MIKSLIKCFLIAVILAASARSFAAEKIVACNAGERPTGCRSQLAQCIRGGAMSPAETCRQTFAQGLCARTFSWESCCMRVCTSKQKNEKSVQSCVEDCNETAELKSR